MENKKQEDIKYGNEAKIPMPPIPPKSTLYKSISFWADVLFRLDKKVQSMEEALAFGDIGIIFKFRDGKINRIVWVDEVSDLVLTEKGGGKTELSHEREK